MNKQSFLKSAGLRRKFSLGLLAASTQILIACSPAPDNTGYCAQPIITECRTKDWLKAQDLPDFMRAWLKRLADHVETERKNCGYPEPKKCVKLD